MGLTRSEQWTLALVLTLVMAGFAIQRHRQHARHEGVWVEPGTGWRPIPLDAASSGVASIAEAGSPAPSPPASAAPRAGLIDINHAHAAELELLPGIGPVKAAAIVQHRQERGAFASADALTEVKGIGPRTLEKLRPLVTVGDPAPRPQGASNPIPTATKPALSAAAPPQAAVTTRIALNHATAAELETLPGIGPVLAQRIIEYRQSRPFRSVDELQNVRGIGPKTLDRLRDRLRID